MLVRREPGVIAVSGPCAVPVFVRHDPTGDGSSCTTVQDLP